MALDFLVREYTLDDVEKFTSTFFNNVIDDFLKNILSIYRRFQRLYETHAAYKSSTTKTIAWLISEINAISSAVAGKIRLSGYTAPTSTNIQVDSVYGQLSLLENSVVSKIPTVENEYGENIAVASCEAAKGVAYTGPWSYPDDIRNVIDDTDKIWYAKFAGAATDSGCIYIKVKTTTVSESDNVSYINVFPLMGTKVVGIKYGDITETFDTAWPVKIHRKIESFQNEIVVKLQGVADGADYYFGVREIGVYKCDYADTGVLSYTFDLGVTTGLSSILLDSPYIIPSDLAKNRPVTIKIKTTDDSITAYDTSGVTVDVPSMYPLEQDLTLDNTKSWKIELTLNKIEERTPVVKGVTLETIS